MSDLSDIPHLLPPPLAALVSGAGIWTLAERLPQFSLPYLLPPKIAADVIPWMPFAAGGIAAVGLGLGLSAILSFASHEDKLTPMVPSTNSRLVTSGVYAYTRNPMYLGLATLLTAWTTYLEQPLGLLGVAGFVGFINWYMIKPEEEILLQIFPVEYPEYKRRVPRWIF